MDSRDAALAALLYRLLRASAGEDPGALLGEDALWAAGRLLALTDPGSDLIAANALGMFHWWRCLILPAGSGEDDFVAADVLLAPVFRDDPDAVPEPLRNLYQQRCSRDDGVEAHLVAQVRSGAVLRTAYERTGEL